MNIKYALETFKLILVIFNVSYFTGIFWLIFCDFMQSYNETNKTAAEISEMDSFMSQYNIQEYPKQRQVIIGMYYSFTSLSTVGFGDFHPENSSERILCSIILIFGVAIFSYIMGKFVEMIEAYKIMNADLDEGDELAKFLGML